MPDLYTTNLSFLKRKHRETLHPIISWFARTIPLGDVKSYPFVGFSQAAIAEAMQALLEYVDADNCDPRLVLARIFTALGVDLREYE